MPAPAPATASSSAPIPASSPIKTPVPLPVLKPGETVTWIKVDRPRFPISEILASALSIAGIAALFSIALGILIGHFKARRREQGTTGLGLR